VTLAKSQSLKNRYKGAMLGLAIGDALGAPVEFQKRGTFEPISSFRGGGKFSLQAGEWTDDTAMTLCLAQSLVEQQGFDPLNQLEKYVTWLHTGYMSCNGKAVGVGKTIYRSLIRYMRTKQPYTDIVHEKFSGNGSLMRLAPVCIYYAKDMEQCVEYAKLSSKTTHGSPVAVDCCRYMAYVIVRLFSCENKEEVFSEKFKEETWAFFRNEKLHEALEPIVCGTYMEKSNAGILSTGYAVHSLEAALWSFYHSNSFEKALLLAVNLGDDADTVGAITGQIAGAFYGVEKIPESWKKNLCKYEMIDTVMDRLIDLMEK